MEKVQQKITTYLTQLNAWILGENQSKSALYYIGRLCLYLGISFALSSVTGLLPTPVQILIAVALFFIFAVLYQKGNPTENTSEKKLASQMLFIWLASMGAFAGFFSITFTFVCAGFLAYYDYDDHKSDIATNNENTNEPEVELSSSDENKISTP